MLFPFSGEIFELLIKPMHDILPEGHNMLAIDVVSPVMTRLKAVFFCSILLSLPVIAYEIWSFLAPALYKKEKKLLLPIIISSTFMFFVGLFYCYFVVFHMVFGFIAGFTPESVAFSPDIDSCTTFMLKMFLAFGISFEIPVAVFITHSVHAVSLEIIKKSRRYVIVGAFVISAIITPPDIMSQILLALPIVILYEIGLITISCCSFKRQQPSVSSPKT